MHTNTRTLTLLSLCVLMLPAMSGLASLTNREDAQKALKVAMNAAVHAYQRRGDLAEERTAEALIVEQKKVGIVAMEHEKLQMRRAIVKERRIIAAVEQKYGLTIASKQSLEPLVAAEQRKVARSLQGTLAEMINGTFDVKNTILHLAVGAVSTDVDSAEASNADSNKLHDLAVASDAFDELDVLMPERERMLAKYAAADADYEQAAKTLADTDAQLKDIQDTMNEVREQVMGIQNDLARIDARLKAKEERRLIEQGLLKPEDVQEYERSTFQMRFSWPVYGILTAGFMDPDYKKRFGIEHHGQDIAVPQETPVAAAADGIVYTVHDGGETGYSYILIGHRDGYATLYGHVSEALVKAGQEVNAGDIIALSGGTPGMHGSGPMTTAAHLHFEIIKNKVNIDPKTMLP